MSNRIREIAKEKGRKLIWLGAKIGKPRNLFNYMINENRFTPEQKVTIAQELQAPVAEVFPEDRPA